MYGRIIIASFLLQFVPTPAINNWQQLLCGPILKFLRHHFTQSVGELFRFVFGVAKSPKIAVKVVKLFKKPESIV